MFWDVPYSCLSVSVLTSTSCEVLWRMLSPLLSEIYLVCLYVSVYVVIVGLDVRLKYQDQILLFHKNKTYYDVHKDII